MGNPIPEMTWEQKQAWKQPDANTFDFDFAPGHVVMTQAQRKQLARYDTTLPSGVYEGKMWICDWGNGTDRLVWFGESHLSNQCLINHRTILLKEALDLIQG
jgi:hypothetical protein